MKINKKKILKGAALALSSIIIFSCSKSFWNAHLLDRLTVVHLLIKMALKGCWYLHIPCLTVKVSIMDRRVKIPAPGITGPVALLLMMRTKEGGLA